jgi:molybdate transport system substrate-binding protein
VFRLVAALLVATILHVNAVAKAQDRPLTIFAAASLKTAMDEIAANYGKEKLTLSYAASSALAKQIESGAPADIFISADLKWMDYLDGKKLVKSETVQNLLGNRLVLVAPADSTVTIEIKTGFELAAALKGGKLAMADVSAVPAGTYGKEALTTLGVWDQVSAQVAQAENVRAALKLVALKEAALGIVYGSDAIAEPMVKVVGTFPADSHAPIVYPMAVLASSTHTHAGDVVAYLKSEAASAVFRKNGFDILPP